MDPVDPEHCSPRKLTVRTNQILAFLVNTISCSTFKTFTKVADRHQCNAVTDPAFHLNADPDPAFHFNSNPDPAPHQSDGNLQKWSVYPPGLHFEPPDLHCERPLPPTALFWASKASEYLL